MSIRRKKAIREELTRIQREKGINMGKSIFKSKTFYFNILTIILGFLAVVNKTFPLDPQTLVFINGIGNLLLRLVSDRPIVFKGRTLLGRRVA